MTGQTAELTRFASHQAEIVETMFKLIERQAEGHLLLSNVVDKMIGTLRTLSDRAAQRARGGIAGFMRALEEQ